MKLNIPLEGKREINFYNGYNQNIIDTLIDAVPRAIEQCKNEAAKFKGNSIIDTCKNVWAFVKHKIKYQVDKEGTQVIQLPSALLHSKLGDCKSKTLLSVALLSNLLPECKIYIRFASYDKNNKVPTHVYCYVVTPKNEIIIVDPVWHYFNSEKTYIYKQDFQIMQISTVSGFEASYDDIGKTKKNKKKKSGQGGAKGFIKKGINRAKKVYGAPIRGAFLTLITINARGLASKLKMLPRDKVIKVWQAFGGNPDKLYATVQKGAARKPFLGQKHNENVEGIGVVAVASVAATLAAAAPIIIALKPLFDQIASNKDKKETEDLLKEAEDAGGKMEIPKGEIVDGEEGSGKKNDGSKGGGGMLDFLTDIPTPVKLLGGAALAYGGYQLMKGKKRN